MHVCIFYPYRLDGQTEAGESGSSETTGAEGGMAVPEPAIPGGFSGGATFAAVTARNEQKFSSSPQRSPARGKRRHYFRF